MGVVVSKCYNKHFVEPRELRARICVLEEEMKEIRREKEQKEQVFALERRKQKEEMARLRRRVEEEEERVRRLEGEAKLEAIGGEFGGNEGEWRRLEMDYIVEHMREEQARREAAVEKWKQLYLAIKTELDELILRTKEGGRFYWASEQGLVVEKLQRELNAKEEALETLRAKIVSMERDGTRKEREIDILRQSLKILNNSKRNRSKRNVKRMLNM